MMETRQQQIERETLTLCAFQRKADDISRLIIGSDLPWVDVQIRIEQLRAEAQRLFPQKMRLFDLIYISRFKRLWEQWHGSN